MTRAALIALAFGPLALFGGSGPALAQSDGEKINQLIVYGDDPCPQSSENEITVCARKGESERYRIPVVLRADPLSPKNEPWTERVEAYETVGARKGEAERYRIPEVLRGDPLSPKNEAWTDRVQAYETVGAQGIASCSPVGSGGATGCMAKLIDAAYAEKREGGDIRFGQLIETERAKRLSTLDSEAAATQARVEQLEKEYDARIKAERDAEIPGTAAPLPTPGK